MFGLVTMAAAHYLSSSSPLMRPSVEVEVEELEEERAQGGGRAEGEEQRRTPTTQTGSQRFTSDCRC